MAERGLSSFQIKLIIWSFFIVLIDGYDIAAIAFAAPHLVKSWGVAPNALGPVFSASLVGILFGSAIFGWVGDRFGRKVALVGSNLLFGVFTLAAAYSTNLDQMFWLRLLAGIGIGGVIPNVVAINTESAPRNLRATLAIIAVGCVPIGGAIPGFVTAVFVAQYGWPILFLIGGIVPIVIAVAAFIGLPESIKYLALHESQRGKVEKLIAAIRPDFKVPANARFMVEDEKQFPGFNPVYLFREGEVRFRAPQLWKPSTGGLEWCGDSLATLGELRALYLSARWATVIQDVAGLGFHSRPFPNFLSMTGRQSFSIPSWKAVRCRPTRSPSFASSPSAAAKSPRNCCHKFAFGSGTSCASSK
jgi:MFS family permease